MSDPTPPGHDAASSPGPADAKGSSGRLDPSAPSRHVDPGSSRRDTRPPWPNPFVFGFVGALGVLTAWLLVQAIATAGSMLLLIVVSLFLAIGLNPAVEFLRAHNLSKPLAITVVFLGVILVFIGSGVALVPPLTEQSAEFVQRIPGYARQLQANPTIRELDERFQLLQRLVEYVSSGAFGSQLFGGLLGFGQVVIGAIFNALTVLVLTLYFLGSMASMKEAGYRLVPRSRRVRAKLLGDAVIEKIGGYVAGNLVISLIAGLTTFFFLMMLRVPYALALAMIVAVTDLIPLVGAFIGAVVASAVGFFVSVPVGIGCVIFFIVYQQIENYWIAPRIMQSSVDVPPVATIVGALIGGALLGVIGALLAIPLAAALLIIVREVVLPRQEQV
ncbi:AI-2E family transporter [Nonomuraea africana]|uniref:PurR-regulated permease PerM n=1 Tax=Nonomuraea africana TaxID=46171 RepID=A0ABR9KNE3_9ACTN|nr:AI-2E family transporter [Nonomuraea africana]MBE1563544.1 putative PurR-regulated permease PerM [Nonomuraea africana]